MVEAESTQYQAHGDDIMADWFLSMCFRVFFFLRLTPPPLPTESDVFARGMFERLDKEEDEDSGQKRALGSQMQNVLLAKRGVTVSCP